MFTVFNLVLITTHIDENRKLLNSLKVTELIAQDVNIFIVTNMYFLRKSCLTHIQIFAENYSKQLKQKLNHS